MPNRHEATTAAIRTAYGHRLSPADYRDLLNLHSVAEIVSYLKETESYGDLLRGLEPVYTHRGYLEMLLRRNLFLQCRHFCALEHLQDTPFYRFFIYDAEVRELIKKLQLMPGGAKAYISAMDATVAPYLSFQTEKLARAENAADLIAAAAQTPYKDVLKKHLRPDGTPKDFTACEIALRACCLERIQKEANATLTGSDLDALKGLIAEQADLINLINAYRLKRVFRADEDTLRRMMLPIPGKLPARIFEELYAAADLGAFIEVLRKTRYGRLLGDITRFSDQPESIRLEHAIQTLRCRSARRALHFSGHAAVSLYAMHVLCRIETENLITIIEGIRYEKPVSYIESLLIME